MTWDRILKIISYLGLIFNILSGIKNEILDIPDRKKKKKKRKEEENFPKNPNKSAHSRKVKILIHLESLYQPTLIIEPNPFTTAPKRRLYFNPPLPCFLKQYYFIEHCDSPHRIDQNPDLSKIPSRSPTLSIPIFTHLTTRHRPPNYPKYSFEILSKQGLRVLSRVTIHPNAEGITHAFARVVVQHGTKSRSTAERRDKVYPGFRILNGIEKINRSENLEERERESWSQIT